MTINKKRRSKHLTSHHTLGFILCQWHYRHDTEKYLTSGFKSLVKINGRWNLDLPYFCYSGKHTYRPLPKSLSAYVSLRVLIGNTKRAIADKIKSTRMTIAIAKINAKIAVGKLPGVARYKKWRNDRYVRKYFGI